MGSSFSILGSLFASVSRPLCSNQATNLELSYDLASLRDLHQAFVDVSADDFRVVNFYEKRKEHMFKIWIFRWDEFVSYPLSKRQV